MNLKTQKWFEDVIKKNPKLQELDLIPVDDYKNSHIKMKFTTKFGIVEIFPYSLKTGSVPTITSAINKTDYYINQLYNKHPHLKKLIPVSDYNSGKEKMIFKDEYGLVAISPQTLLSEGNTPSIKTALDKTAYFKAKLLAIYKDKYDYSKLEYKGAKIKINIICKKHNFEFKMNPYDHLLGHGCSKCYLENNNSYSTKRALKYKSDLEKVKGILYTIRLFNETESFYKIGITANSVKSRYWGHKKIYNYEIIDEINSNLFKCIVIENYIHKNNNEYRYTPNKDFKGWTECYYKNLNIKKLWNNYITEKTVDTIK